MSETQSGSDHHVFDTRGDEVACDICRDDGGPGLENGEAIREDPISLLLVRDTRSESECRTSRLRAQCAKRNNVYVFSVEEIKAACDQVSQVAESMLGQTGGLPGDVVLHLLKGILEGTASLRGEGLGQEAPAGNVLTDVAEHGDVTRIEGDVSVVPVAGAL